MDIDRLLNDVKNRKPQTLIAIQLSKFCDGRQNILADKLRDNGSNINEQVVNAICNYTNEVFQYLQISPPMTVEEWNDLQKEIRTMQKAIEILKKF